MDEKKLTKELKFVYSMKTHKKLEKVAQKYGATITGLIRVAIREMLKKEGEW